MKLYKKYIYALVLVQLFSVSLFAQDSQNQAKRILILGNSITAGYGLDISQAYPAILQNKIDSLDLNYKVINAGLSGETTSGGLRRVNWLLKQPVDIFILALGGNDGLRGIKLELSKENLEKIIDLVRKKNKDTKIILAGMQIPPNMGERYTQKFRQMYTEIAQKKKTELIPFLLNNVGGIKELNLPDGIHPNFEGQKKVAENVWVLLKPLLK